MALLEHSRRWIFNVAASDESSSTIKFRYEEKLRKTNEVAIGLTEKNYPRSQAGTLNEARFIL